MMVLVFLPGDEQDGAESPSSSRLIPMWWSLLLYRMVIPAELIDPVVTNTQLPGRGCPGA